LQVSVLVNKLKINKYLIKKINIYNINCLGTPQRAGFGGFIRNSAGCYLSGFSGFISNSEDILLAELSAIYYGLSLARDMHIAELVCHADSLLCIGLITGPAKNYHIYAALIQDIKDMIHLSNVTIVHTLREGNQCADFLAKMGASSYPDLSIHCLLC